MERIYFGELQLKFFFLSLINIYDHDLLNDMTELNLFLNVTNTCDHKLNKVVVNACEGLLKLCMGFYECKSRK